MKNKRILVKSSAGRYEIVCGSGALRNASREIRALGKFSRIHVVSSPKVWGAVGKSVLRALGRNGASQLHLMNDAEAAKNLRTVEALARSLVRSGIDRHSLLIAVGGGVVGDVANHSGDEAYVVDPLACGPTAAAAARVALASSEVLYAV